MSDTPIPNRQQPTKKTGNLKMSTAILIGAISLLLVFFTAIFSPCPSNYEFKIYKTLLALGAAGVASSMPGILKLKYKTALISSSGAISVFLIILFLPDKSVGNEDKCSSVFPLTIYVQELKEGQNKHFTSTAKLVFDLGNDIRAAMVGELGKTNFEIPSKYKNKGIRLSIQSDSYDPVQPDSLYILSGEPIYFLLKCKDIFRTITGVVENSDGTRLLKDVLVQCEDSHVQSNDMGRFKLIMPECRDNYTLTFSKERYQLQRRIYYTNSNEFTVRLEPDSSTTISKN